MEHNQLRFESAFVTTPGLKRKLNEDSSLVQFPVFVVADGMGGHSAGDVASAMVVEGLDQLVGRDDVKASEVVEVLADIQSKVTALSDATTSGAGSTITGVVATRGRHGQLEWVVVNLGDSRTYRALGGLVTQVTRDHSLVQEMVDEGELTREQARVHPKQNVITKAIGDGESEPDFWVTPIVPGERVLIVSDGALEGVSDEDLKGLLRECPGREESASTLAELALINGGSDNITIVVVDVEGTQHAEHLPSLTPLGEVEEQEEAEVEPWPDDTTVEARVRRRT